MSYRKENLIRFAVVIISIAATIAEPVTGSFKLMALLQQIYRIEIISANDAYNYTTVTNVSVIAQQNNDIGTITLSSG